MWGRIRRRLLVKTARAAQRSSFTGDLRPGTVDTLFLVTRPVPDLLSWLPRELLEPFVGSASAARPRSPAVDPASCQPPQPELAPPDLPPRSCTRAFLRCASPPSTAQLVDVVRAAYYDVGTGRISKAQLDEVLRFVGEIRQRLDARRRCGQSGA